MAETQWGDLPVSDAHVHFFSHSFYTGLARQRKVAGAEALVPLLDWHVPPADPQFLARMWVDELDRHGVQRACLIASAHGDEGSVSFAVGISPDRFYGYFMLDPTQPDALDRMKGAAVNPFLHGVCLFPAMHTYSITDSRVVPLLELASDHGMAVFVHFGAISVGVRHRLGLPTQSDMRFSNPLDLHPVALHFPQVRFVVPHFGAGLFREALMLADLCPNVYFDTSSSNRWLRYEELDLRTAFRRSLEVLGPDRLLFGTDSSFFPRGWQSSIFEDQCKALYELALERDQVGAILSTNLDTLLSGRAAALPPSKRTQPL